MQLLFTDSFLFNSLPLCLFVYLVKLARSSNLPAGLTRFTDASDAKPAKCELRSVKLLSFGRPAESRRAESGAVAALINILLLNRTASPDWSEIGLAPSADARFVAVCSTN